MNAPGSMWGMPLTDQTSDHDQVNYMEESIQRLARAQYSALGGSGPPSLV